MTDQSDQKMVLNVRQPAAVKAELLATDLTVADHAGRLVTMDPTGTLKLILHHLQSFQLLILLLQDQIRFVRTKRKYNWYNF